MKKRKDKPSRYRKVKGNASVDSAERTAEKTLGLPSGSVKICLPSGRKARTDGSVDALRERWRKGK